MSAEDRVSLEAYAVDMMMGTNQTEPTCPSEGQEDQELEQEPEQQNKAENRLRQRSTLDDILASLDNAGDGAPTPSNNKTLEGCRDELNRYIQSQGLPIVQNTPAVDGKRKYHNPLVWWSQNERFFPILSKLAKRILAIPATSCPSERVFSVAGRIVSARRAKLSTSNVSMLLFLKEELQWYEKRSGTSEGMAMV